jgi:hypothetical protein
MLVEYPQEFDTPYWSHWEAKVLLKIQYTRALSLSRMLRVCPRNSDLIGNRFNARTIFKTKHTLRGTLMKTGLVRETQ